MLLNCISVVVYSLLFSTPVGYVKSSVLMLRSVLKLIVSILHVLIKLNYMPIATMDFKMQLEQGLRKMHRDWDVKSILILLLYFDIFLILRFCDNYEHSSSKARKLIWFESIRDSEFSFRSHYKVFDLRFWRWIFV